MNQKPDLLLNWRFMTSYPGWAYVSLGRNFVLLLIYGTEIVALPACSREFVLVWICHIMYLKST